MTEQTDKQIDLSGYQPAENFLADRDILVTGASDGIGKAVAIALASYGATVTLLGKTAKKLENTYEEIENSGSPQPALCPLDLEKADEAAYGQLANILQENFGKLDGIVHCAAWLGSHSPIANSSYELWQSVLQINLTAPYLIMKACYPLLAASDNARVVFSSDSVASRGSAYWGAYSVSKAGQDNMMQILSNEWEANHNIVLNSLDPGPVRTSLRKQVFPGEDPTSLAKPDDVVLPYLYLQDPQTTISGIRLRWQADRQILSIN